MIRKVSVIIPNYNHANFLKLRIESVLNQTLQDFELIILDDKSTDDSKEVIESYRNHPKISHIIYNETNSGNTFIQWQKGFELSKGEFIWIAESDDYCEPTLLENLIKGFDNENCVLAYCQSLMFRGNEIVWKLESNYLESSVDGKEFIKTRMLEGNTIFNASMVLFKKSVLEKIDNTYTTFSFCGDWLFWMEIAKLGDVYISGKYLNYFRKHDKDVSGRAYASGLNFIEEIKILELLKVNNLINEIDFLKALKVKYLRFKSLKNIKNKESITKAFLIDRKTITFLRKNEFSTIKRIIKFLKSK